jgi:hypothetical protein
MKAKELKSFLDTLPSETEIQVCNVMDGNAERLPIQSVLLNRVLPSFGGPMLQDGGVVYLCTWEPVFLDLSMASDELRAYTKTRALIRETRRVKDEMQKMPIRQDQEVAMG